ncbi:hydrolase [Coprinopsis sp. MPI-PUGE-AT-0042]|nr:hydrolase [Coprinopsis sp. MPI-PUGE-AT-0042]
MGKKKSNTPGEEHLLMPAPPTTLPIVDTHTHILMTYNIYQAKYNKDGSNDKFPTIYDFVNGMCKERNVESIVDVWCEPGAWGRMWKEMADSDKWDGPGYNFVMGTHEARHYTDEVESQILEAMAHPRCVGWGEFGLDYHYDNSPRDVQREVFTRQLRQAVKLGKPLTIHTREAEEDCERILKAEVPREHKIHVHCFTDSPTFASRLLDHFPNLYIGITGVISYATNFNTSNVIRNMVGAATASSREPVPDSNLRIVLETDGPYMVPANLYEAIPAIKGKKLPLCHTAMIPWTAQFIANVAAEGWDADRVMRVARENARFVYGV